jgi:hypothetical protein
VAKVTVVIFFVIPKTYVTVITSPTDQTESDPTFGVSLALPVHGLGGSQLVSTAPSVILCRTNTGYSTRSTFIRYWLVMVIVPPGYPGSGVGFRTVWLLTRVTHG